MRLDGRALEGIFGIELDRGRTGVASEILART